ncbi:MAG: ATPase [Halobacteriaceae archaeon]
MQLLVAGAAEVDAGKTTFSIGLLERVGGVGFKPRAGNDYWYDHDDYERATTDGRLYGNDARRLAAASAADLAPEEINPVHRLWRPAPGEAGLVGPEGRAFVCDRVGDGYVVNAAADVPPSARERLPLADAERVADIGALNEVARERHLPALAALGERVRATGRAVVESYGDIALPVRELTPDAAAVVEPGRVRVYGGAPYARAHEATETSAAGQLEQPVGAVVGPLDPAATVGLPALPAEQRADPGAVADAYEVAYDALLGVAVG